MSRRRFAVRTGVALLAALSAGLLLATQLPANALTVTGTSSPVTGNATHFDALGSPYGGCGLPQQYLDSQNFVALNVYNTPGDYSFYPRPVTDPAKVGMWDNGLNCGRWVKVTIGDYCTGVNDGAANQPFCRNGSWVSDEYNGATLTMVVADSCGDSNAWCRDDPYHLDLATDSLNRFIKDGAPVGDMNPDHWNNRQVHWQFVPAPDYSGDISIGFLRGAQVWWPAIAISHLPNGIHGVDYYTDGAWHAAQMNSDMGESYIIDGTTSGADTFQIRVHDADDALLNGGRVYSFSLPSACSSQCSAAYTPVSYTTSGGSTTSPTPPASPTAGTSPTPSTTPSTGPTTSSPTPSTGPTTGSPTTGPTGGSGPTCSATLAIVNQWSGGWQASVTVTNTGTVTIHSWQVTLDLPAGSTVSQGWNGTFQTSGGSVTITNASYNGTLAPGQSTTVGFLGTGPTPTGASCTCS